MNEGLITAMREMLGDARGLPPSASYGLNSWWRAFAEHPAEAAEVLERLFAEYDAGADNATQIRTVLMLRRSAHKYVSVKRTEALKRFDAASAARHDANYYPPTARRKLHLGMLGVVHQRDCSDECEAIVMAHPAAAQELLGDFVREQRRDHFFDDRSFGVRRNTQCAINVLRAMIARCECRRLLDEMGGA